MMVLAAFVRWCAKCTAAPRAHGTRMSVGLLLLSLLAAAPAASVQFNWTTAPARTLPDLNGSAFPRYRQIFEAGECNHADALPNGREYPLPRGAGTTRIDPDKICFSCFRIPTVLAGLTPGVIHAFAEGRRGELAAPGGCPDGPDTRLVYKRSADNGATWSLLSVFLQDPAQRAENGLCQAQAAPVIDPVTKTLFVGFTANLPGCQAPVLRAKRYKSTPMLVKSSDDGLHWSEPYELANNSVKSAFGPSFGPTKGLTVKHAGGGVRLLLPGENGWSAAVSSDDAGATWKTNALNRSYTLSPGEMDWTICSTGTACPPGMKYIMVSRAYGGLCKAKTMCTQFSADGLVWSEPVATINADNVSVGQGHAKPGIVAVPGAFISSQTLELCPTGVKMNHDQSCGTPGTAFFRKRQPNDVYESGMCLMISKDGIHWSLFKKTWPIGGMYSTAAGLTFDEEGAALTYGIVFAGGRLPVAPTGNIMYMNFTAVHPNGTMDAELASAIAKLGGAPYTPTSLISTTAPMETTPSTAATAAGKRPASSIFYAAPALPDMYGSGYPPHRLVFRPGECTRNDGPGQHPLPPGPPPRPPPPPPAPPPAPHQCMHVHVHHTQGCYNYSDWKPGTPSPVLPLYEAAVGAKLTLEACGAACYKSDPAYALAGVEGGNRCFCGKPADLATVAAKLRSIPARAQCETKPCVGDPTRERGCGGVGTMLAYAFSCDKVAFTGAGGDTFELQQPPDSVSSSPDDGGGATTLIDTNKTCFSCFRIPTMLAGQTPGVVHAFAEGRRSEGADVYHCPDGPDTRLVYKRSSDYGATWSSLSVFTQDPTEEAENGLCQSQASPVIDPVTKTLFVGYIDNGAGCLVKGNNWDTSQAKPTLVRSTDDGLSFSKPLPFMLNQGPGRPAVPTTVHQHVAIGPTKGLTIKRAGGGVRLQLPGEADSSSAIFSDDHGATWHVDCLTSGHCLNRSYTLSPGEMDWTICSNGTSCPPGMKFLMVNRAGGKVCPTMCSQFSADGVTWSKQIPTVNAGNLLVGQGHAKPGVVAVPGAFISSQTLLLCPPGVKMTGSLGHEVCGTPDTPSYRERQPDDVLGSGMCLMISKDGIHWSLFKKTWPIGGMYSTAAGLTFDEEGAALTYGIVFAGGSLPWSRSGHIYYMNFTAVHPNGTMDAELASAIAKL